MRDVDTNRTVDTDIYSIAFIPQTADEGTAPRCLQCHTMFHHLGALGILHRNLDTAEHRQPAWLHVHDARPSGIGVVGVCEAHNRVVSQVALCLGGSKKLDIHLCGRLHGVLHQLEESIAAVGGHHVPQLLHAVGEPAILLHAPVGISACPPLDGAVLIPVSAVALFSACPAHKLRPTYVVQTIVLAHHFGHRLSQLRSELPAHESPELLILVGFRCRCMPGHVHPAFYEILGRLYIAHIQNPHLPDATTEGFRHLPAHEERRHGAYPQIVVGPTPVARVVVDAVTPAAVSLGRIGEMTDIAVVVVGPHECHIVGHMESLLVYIEHLLVGHKHLRHTPQLAFIEVERGGQHASLVVDSHLQVAHLVVHSACAQHGTIVKSAHTERVNNLLILYVVKPLLPEGLYALPVAHIVVFTLSAHGPFGGCRAGHGFAVRATYVYTILLRHLSVAGDGEEGLATFMHSRPIVVGPQAQHELEYTLVHLRTYDSLG